MLYIKTMKIIQTLPGNPRKFYKIDTITLHEYLLPNLNKYKSLE